MRAELVWAALSASACLNGSASAFSAYSTRESASCQGPVTEYRIAKPSHGPLPAAGKHRTS